MNKILPLALALYAFDSKAQTELVIPDTLSGPTYDLTMHVDSVPFFPSGNISHTYAFNQFKYLGPTLIFNQGENISLNVHNHIDDTTTVHWHGLHVAAVNDGGPHSIILQGQDWNPQFTVTDKAATYWYHPHTHKKTAKQAIKGAAGMIIIRDAEEAALVLPRKYGIDDFPVIVQSQQYDSLNQALPKGMEDSTLIVNGARANNGYSVYANFPAQVIRMRILNASGERSFNFGLSGNKPFFQITSDGGLLDAPVALTRVRLSPGERAEILVDLSGMQGQSIYLMSYGSELPMGVQGGPTMPMPPGNPPMDSPLNGADFNIFQINVVAQTANPVISIPTSLTTNVPYLESQAMANRTINMTAASMMSMDGPFYFNGQLFDMMRIDYLVPMNNIEIWTLTNQTMVAHPFHIHGLQFFILDRDGNPPDLNERGRKDVVLVSSMETVRFIAKFEDYSDTIVPYMYHCHILMHEDDGMMGQYAISTGAAGIKTTNPEEGLFSLYPNPANKILNIEMQGDKEMEMNVYNTLGQLMLTEKITGKKTQIDVSNWSEGMFYVILKGDNLLISKKLIIK